MDDVATKKYLASFLKISPLSHALWRTVEAQAFGKIDYKQPILDLGCGWGEFAGIVFNQMEMGIDINKKELKRALKGNKYKNVLWADARQLPFKSHSYKTVVSVSVLEHIDNAGLVLKEIHRILRKDGLLVFTVPTTKLYDDLLFPKICSKVGLTGVGKNYFRLHCRVFKHIWLKTPTWWTRELQKCGFEIIMKEGTVSPTTVKLHEIFLLTAWPSQLWKLIMGRRLLISSGLRAWILPKVFGKFVYPDTTSYANIFFVAKKI